MAKGDRSQKDKQMASYLKETGQVAPRKWRGVGSDVSAQADKMGALWKGRYSSTFERGMLGGMLAEKLGYKIPYKVS